MMQDVGCYKLHIFIKVRAAFCEHGALCFCTHRHQQSFLVWLLMYLRQVLEKILCTEYVWVAVHNDNSMLFCGKHLQATQEG